MKQPEPGRDARRSRQLLLAVGALLALILMAWWVVSPRFRAQEYASFTRPDGRYRVVVVRTPAWPALMPGQASDAPGRVELYDQHGKLLRETKIDMVQLVDHVDWEEKKVRIKLIAEWDLPD
jgi:hypothetical protein